MRTGGDRGLPRTDVRNRAGRRAAVSGRCRDEHARVLGEEERDLDGIEEVRLRTADRVVDDIDAVSDRLVDGGHEIGSEAARRGAVLRRPQRLVRRDARPRRDAADLAERGCGARRLNAVVAARRRGHVRAVPVVVAGRHELPRTLCLDRSIAAPRGVVVLGTDQLPVAVGRVEVLARRAVPPVPLVEPRHGVDELAVGVTVGEALRLRPDARVDVADDDALARADAVLGAVGTAELIPQSHKHISRVSCWRRPGEVRSRAAWPSRGSRAPGRGRHPRRRARVPPRAGNARTTQPP